MADANVSDASPPRRRSRRDDTNTSVQRYRSPLASEPHHSVAHQPSPSLRSSSPPRRLPESGAKVRARRTSQDGFKEERADTRSNEDVSDASPPRQRRRIDYPSPQDASNAARIPFLNKNSFLNNHAIRVETLSRRGSRPGPSTFPDEAISMRSIAATNREQRADHSYHPSTSAPGQMRSINTARAPRNRFGIQPGPRWDGVIRSNGFEDRLEAMQAMRKDVELEGYRASVADL